MSKTESSISPEFDFLGFAPPFLVGWSVLLEVGVGVGPLKCPEEQGKGCAQPRWVRT